MSRYDYSQPGYYFVTICTRDKMCIFGEPGCLNQYGQMAHQGLVEIEKHFQGVKVDKSIVMPNHVHAIIVLRGNDTNLSVVIGQYKSTVSRVIHTIDQDQQVWQSSYHDHVIRNEEAYQKIWSYIDANPMRWKDDCFYMDSSF